MSKLNLTTVIALILCIAVLSCRRNNDDNNNDSTCSGPVKVTWKVDGNGYKASTVLAIVSGSVFNLTIVACTESPDRTISLGFIPHPPATGSYPIRNDQSTGKWNGTVQGAYSVGSGASNSGSYFTDSFVNYGTFTISSINTSNKTFSGGFNFKAKEKNSAVINLTEAVFTDVKYP